MSPSGDALVAALHCSGNRTEKDLIVIATNASRRRGNAVEVGRR